MVEKLSTFRDIVQALSNKYNVPFEIVESILIDWIKVLYEDMAESLGKLPSFGL